MSRLSPSYVAYRGGAAAAELVPEWAGERIARRAGRLAGLVMAERRRMLERNLVRASGGTLSGDDLRRAVDAGFESYGRYWLELFRLRRDLRRPDFDDRIHLDGYEHVEAGLAAGRGVILALPHLGGWELAGAWLARQGVRPAVVVEPVEPPELFEWFAGVRRDLGMEVIPLGPDAAPALLRALRDNRVVALVSDRDLSGDGVEVEFFGERTTLPAGPAMLALRTGAALLPVAVYFEPDGGHRGVVLPPRDTTRTGRLRDDIARITQDLARSFEVLIEAAPEQWHLMQPNWPSDRDPA